MPVPWLAVILALLTLLAFVNTWLYLTLKSLAESVQDEFCTVERDTATTTRNHEDRIHRLELRVGVEGAAGVGSPTVPRNPAPTTTPVPFN